MGASIKLFIFIIFNVSIAYGSYEIQNGFFIDRGIKRQNIESLYKVKIFCNYNCIIQNGSEEWLLSAGFGDANEVMTFNLIERKQMSRNHDESILAQNPQDEEVAKPEVEQNESLVNESGVVDTDASSNKEIQYQAPYPVKKSIFLNRSGGKILVYPKSTCDSVCSLEIANIEGRILSLSFQKNQRPFSFITIESKQSGHIKVKFKDGSDFSEQTIRVEPYSSKSFVEFLKLGYSVEIL